MSTPSKILPKFKEGTDYVTLTWGEGASAVPNYGCAKCQFQTIDSVAMNKHLNEKKHTFPPWPKVLSTGEEINGVHPAIAAKKGKA